MKLAVKCNWCGKTIEKYPSTLKKHNFCSRECLAAFSSKSKNPEGYAQLKDFTNMALHFSRLAKELNPTRMTAKTREKLRLARLNTGQGISYRKYYGKHEHRIAAERMLGRQLVTGEVVHHIDGDKRNNSPDNLWVFPSQREHAQCHYKLRKFFMDGGDAE